MRACPTLNDGAKGLGDGAEVGVAQGGESCRRRGCAETQVWSGPGILPRGARGRWAALSFGLFLSVGNTTSGISAEATRPEPGFEVQGEFTWEILGDNSEHRKFWRFDFGAKVAGPIWEIRVQPRPGATARDIRLESFLAACDGSTIYDVCYFLRGGSEGGVFPHVVPNHEPYFAPVWLAFCSGAYFQELCTNQIPVPIPENVFSGNSIRGLLALEYWQTAFWDLADSPPRTPRLFQSVDDGRIKRARGNWYVITEERYAPPWERGFTNIVFRVDDYAAVGPFSLPRSAELEVYWLRPPAPRPVLLHRMTVTVREAVATNVAIIVPPALRGVAWVGDWRFTVSNRLAQVTYVTTNRFLSHDEVRADEFAVRHATESWGLLFARGPLRAATAPKARWFPWMAGLLTVALAISLAIARKKHKSPE